MRKIGQRDNGHCGGCRRDEETAGQLLQCHKIKDEELQIMNEGTGECVMIYTRIRRASVATILPV